jgi:hypothetical protein
VLIALVGLLNQNSFMLLSKIFGYIFK